jgi:Sap, sulfolipid-1-addressing protein
MSFLQILPLAFVMIAGPQIISAFFLATSQRWAANSLAYVVGAAVSITTFATIAYFIASGAKDSADSEHTANRTLDWIILALLVVLILRVYLTRKTSHPPKWMAKLQAAEPRFAFVLGLLLLGIFPTDILTSVTAGLYVGRHDDPWWHLLPFVGLALVILAAPSIGVVLLGKRADVVLPRVRDWMNRNAWVVSLVVLIFFAGLTINGLVSD